MQLLRDYKWLVICTLAYIIPFTAYFLSQRNGEFIWYIAVVILLIAIVIGTLPRTKLPRGIVWALSLWAFLHLAGGSVKVGETVLYGLQLIPLYNGGGEMILIKYDQLVHAFGFGLCSIVVLAALRRRVNGYNGIGLYAISALAGIGLGVVNEIVEFAAVLVFQDNGVGGYVNTSLDLVFNTIGATVAVAWKWLRNSQGK